MKKFNGQVVSNKMDKTAVVEVVRFKTHPLYRKKIKVKRKFSVHDEKGVKLGDRVIIGEIRPMSKTKKWQIMEVIDQTKGK